MATNEEYPRQELIVKQMYLRIEMSLLAVTCTIAVTIYHFKLKEALLACILVKDLNKLKRKTL